MDHLIPTQNEKRDDAADRGQEVLETVDEIEEREDTDDEDYIPFFVEAPCLVLCLGSVVFQNLEQRFSHVMKTLSRVVPRKELEYLYSSNTKVKSLEDSLVFFPGMYKL